MNRQLAYIQNYTEGSKYQNHKDFSTKDIARLVRQEVRKTYPAKMGYKISVQYDSFANWSSIDIRVKGVPFQLYNKEYAVLAMAGRWEEIQDKRLGEYTQEGERFIKTLEKIAGQYNYSDCDGMIDYFDVNYWSSVVIDWEAREMLMDKSVEVF